MLSNHFSNIILFSMVLATFSISGAFAVPNGPVIGKVSLVLGQVPGRDQDGDTGDMGNAGDVGGATGGDADGTTGGTGGGYVGPDANE